MTKKYILFTLLFVTHVVLCQDVESSDGARKRIKLDTDTQEVMRASLAWFLLERRAGLINESELTRRVNKFTKKAAAHFIAKTIDINLGIDVTKASNKRSFFRRHKRLFDLENAEFLDEVVACGYNTQGPYSENCIDQIILCIAEARRVRDAA